MLGLGADHEAGDVLEKEERGVALGAELDEVGALEGGGGKKDAVVGEDTNTVTVDVCEAWSDVSRGRRKGGVWALGGLGGEGRWIPGRSRTSNQRLAIIFLEFRKLAAIHDPRDDFSNIHLFPQVRTHDPP